MDYINTPRKIYYLKNNGSFILDTGEIQSLISAERTIDEDFEIYADLKKYTKEAVGCIRLELGQYSEEFKNSLPFVINTKTEEIIFDYTQMKKNIESKINDYQQQIVVLQEELSKIN